MKYGVFTLVFLAAACSSEPSFEKALSLERQKLFTKALEVYSQFVSAHPRDRRAPEALYRKAEIFRREFQVYSEAETAYLKILSDYQNTPWAERAKLGLMRSPDYFPWMEGSQWVEGDSQTGGKNMRVEIAVSTTSGSGFGCLRRTIYAGKNVFSETVLCYEKLNNKLLQYSPKNSDLTTVLLEYPYRVGRTWSLTQKSKIPQHQAACRIEDNNAVVTVRAGTFTRCLKVKEQPRGMTSWSYLYYAPGVGKILTTVATAAGENRVTELLSYNVAKEGS